MELSKKEIAAFSDIPEVVVAIKAGEKLPAGWRYMWDSTEFGAEPCSVIAGDEFGGSIIAIDLPLEKDQAGCYRIYYRP